MCASPALMPTLYLPRGGGPWPWMEMDFAQLGYDRLEKYLRGLDASLPQRPKAMLVVSAHWEAPVPTVMSAAHPPMLYDYGGFPPHTYELSWPAPGAPELAGRVLELLRAKKIEGASDAARGFDHGTFVITGLTHPKADVPTLQLSLQRGLDPRTHLAIGRALEPLRREGVLILGSGMSYHNMRSFQRVMSGAPAGPMTEDSKLFHDWLEDSLRLEADRRDTRLAEWAQAPKARECHPREEHLLPLMVVTGAAADAPAKVSFREKVLGFEVCAARFG